MSTAAAPASAALRTTAPRLCGSCTPSSTTTTACFLVGEIGEDLVEVEGRPGVGLDDDALVDGAADHAIERAHVDAPDLEPPGARQLLDFAQPPAARPLGEVERPDGAGARAQRLLDGVDPVENAFQPFFSRHVVPPGVSSSVTPRSSNSRRTLSAAAKSRAARAAARSAILPSTQDASTSPCEAGLLERTQASGPGRGLAREETEDIADPAHRAHERRAASRGPGRRRGRAPRRRRAPP